MFEEIKAAWEGSQKSRSDREEYFRAMLQAVTNMTDAGCLMEDSILDKIEIGRNGIAIRLNEACGSFLMHINQKDYEEVPISILCYGWYESEETYMVLKLLEYYRGEGITVFDVGANVGWCTLNILSKFPGITVHSFEPGPVTFDRLYANVELNGFDTGNLHNIGLYKETKELDFYYDSEGSGASSLVNLRDKDTVEKISVSMLKMDDWAKEHKIGKVDFIKCDVEGSELFVYEGGIELIKQNRPIIFSEMLRKWSAKFDYTPNDIIKLFERLGYGCFVITDAHMLRECPCVNEDTVETNYFFLHREKHADIIKKMVLV